MDFEKLGAFFLGHLTPPDAAPKAPPQPLVYDAKDLTTHAVCVGMTGSGKTGLCITLLEEAAIDGIPAIAIDLKGDLANLLLTFPELRPEDFAPWIDPAEAARHGATPEQHAADVAARWKKGLADTGQSPDRIRAMRNAVDLAVFTPGLSSGRPLSVLRSLAAPGPAVAADADLLRERIGSTVSSLLALLGIDADPLQSREHILLSQLLLHSWTAGKSISIGELIRTIVDPPIARVGVMDIDTFYSKKDRASLAMRINNLLAAPSFAAWLEGEPLSVERLLWSPEGKPRLSILSLAHLSDGERMFFVTMLLGEMVAWMRSQAGTSSLRALLYMDEVFGFFPPVKNPPSKTPMLTLLKQARAFGLGVVLATQNPVDLDYKGLSNCGTWFLGRLQTKRDLDRVLDGLEGAAASASGSWSRSDTETTLAGLAGRQFMMNDVHRDGPVLFKTRWALSYLRGPLTREQLRSLTVAQSADAATTGVAQLMEPPIAPVVEGAPRTSKAPAAPLERPVLGTDCEEVFLKGDVAQPTYRVGLMATAAMHYTHRHADLDEWLEPTLVVTLPHGDGDPEWGEATWHRESDLRLTDHPDDGSRFDIPQRKDLDEKGMKALKKGLVDHLYRNESLPVFYCRPLKLWSRYGESKAQLAARAQTLLREDRDRDVEKLRKRYAPKIDKLSERIRKAEQKVERERSQTGYQTFDTAISVGATVVGAIFGGRSALTGARQAARGAGRVARERSDVKRAEDDLSVLKTRLMELEQEFEEDTAELKSCGVEAPIEDKSVKAKKADIAVKRFAIIWLPVTSSSA